MPSSLPKWVVLDAWQSLNQVAFYPIERNPLLGHRVPIPYGHSVIVQSVEIDGHCERCPDLVLAAVAPADRAGVVEIDDPPLAQILRQTLRLRAQLLVAGQRK